MAYVEASNTEALRCFLYWSGHFDASPLSAFCVTKRIFSWCGHSMVRTATCDPLVHVRNLYEMASFDRSEPIASLGGILVFPAKAVFDQQLPNRVRLLCMSEILSWFLTTMLCILSENVFSKLLQ